MRDYTKYNSSYTFKYKTGYIHVAMFGSEQVVKVSVDVHAYTIGVKSIHAAKMAITRHIKRSGL